ncbi:MAG: hypothetical protein KC636_15185, partial [Myxococcales bacterium]|nr:hypothetical protein [Myxococcales bacterium]
MIVRDQLARRLAALLRDDPRRVLLGEDARDGGMLGLTRACVEDPELEARVIGTPLVPALALAHAGGLAIAGLRPIVALPSAAALYEGFAALRELCRLSLCTDDERSAPVLLLAPCGPGLGLGGDGADELSSLLAPLSGLRVLACSDPREAAALVREAAEFTAGEQPTVVLLPRDQL